MLLGVEYIDTGCTNPHSSPINFLQMFWPQEQLTFFISLMRILSSDKHKFPNALFFFSYYDKETTNFFAFYLEQNCLCFHSFTESG